MKRKFKSIPEFNEILKNPSPNLKVPVYDESKEGPKPPMRNNNRVTLNQRLDRLEAIVRDGFKQVNDRIDRVEHRLDLVEQRLDYNGLQIVEINKRLDYNGLKPLPNKQN